MKGVIELKFSWTERVSECSLKHLCHRLNCDHNQGGVMWSVLMCIFSVD